MVQRRHRRGLRRPRPSSPPSSSVKALGVLSLASLLSPVSALSSSSSSSSSSLQVLGRDSDWWRDRVLLSDNFRFDGSHSDFAQQFFRLFLDGTARHVDGVANGQLEPAHAAAVTTRLQQAVASSSSKSDELQLRTPALNDLSPLLQRALLWDLGIVKAGDVTYTQVWTQCNSSVHMNELAVSKALYEHVGCTAQPCATPRGDLYYQSLQCNGAQIGNASRCAAASGKSPVHASMWSNGGDDWTLPESFMAKHEWSEGPTNYVVYAIHLADDPNSYGKCVAPSMTVPCVAFDKLSTSDQASWCLPPPSRFVTQWIRAETELLATRSAATKPAPPVEIILSTTLALVVLIVGVWWIVKRRRERRKRILAVQGIDRRDGSDIVSMRHSLHKPDDDGGFASYFFTEESLCGGNKQRRRGMGSDPHAMAVLGGSFNTDFDKTRSFPRDTSKAVMDARRRDDSASFGLQLPLEHQWDDRGLDHSHVTVVGCGAVDAGRETAGEQQVYPMETAYDSPACTSDTSTYVSTCTGDIATTDTVSSSSSSHEDLLSELLHDPRVMAKRVPYIDVSVSRQLSKGAFGEVWVGRMRDQLVAVKQLIPERRTSLRDLDTFITEIRLMAQFHHGNIMSLLGVAWNSPRNLCMMMEFLDNGDLHDLLRSQSREELTWRQEHENTPSDAAGKKASIAVDVASALEYLHGLSPQVVHRDLKSHNILLTHDLVAKLCDFGVSRVNEGVVTMTCGVGTAYWTAPEVLMGDKYTETADVYSFGVVLTELDTHKLPFHDAVDPTSGARLEAIRIMHLVCMGELSPKVSPACPDVIRELAQDCLAQDPTSRPSLDEIIRRLRMMEEPEPFSRDRASSSKEPSSRRRTRMSSCWSLHDDDEQASLPATVSVNEAADTPSPRDTTCSDSGAIWI